MGDSPMRRLAAALALFSLVSFSVRSQVIGGKIIVGGPILISKGVVTGPVRVHNAGSCTSAGATTIAQTITSTTSGNLLTVGEYNENANVSATPSSVVEVSNTVTVSTTLNPGANNYITLQGASPSGFNGYWQVVTSGGANFTYTNPTSGLGTAGSPGAVYPAAYITAGAATFVNDEADTGYGGNRTLMEFHAANIPSGITTVTANLPTSTTGCLWVGEESGLNASTPLDVSCGAGLSCGTNGNTTPFTGPTVTPTASKNEYMFVCSFDSSGPDHSANWTATGVWSIPSGGTPYENGGGFGSFGCFDAIIASTSGNYGMTGTNSGGGFSSFIDAPATFKP
jgi:hypothetical protein